MNRFLLAALAAMTAMVFATTSGAAEGNAAKGQRVFRACAACHSLERDRNMTGPSLASLWQRRAGSLPSFTRYSPALKSSGIVWDDKSLDEWLKDPAHVIPGNSMTFPGIKDAQSRSDLLAFLKDSAQADRAASAPRGGRGMMDMMGAGAAPNLKTLDSQQRVQAISYCKDTYRVTTADGKTRDFWERNLRLKTDSGDDGPEKGAPAIVAAGMMGDRADVIFADPSEISAAIATKC